MLGKRVNQPISQLLGGAPIDEIPIYLSSLRRDTTPEEEVDWVGERLSELGAKAVKFKIGGRMSQDRDAMPKRTEQLIARARSELGDDIAIGVDGNGSFSAHRTIEVGKMLESYGVSFLGNRPMANRLIVIAVCALNCSQSSSRVASLSTLTSATGKDSCSMFNLGFGPPPWSIGERSPVCCSCLSSFSTKLNATPKRLANLR